MADEVQPDRLGLGLIEEEGADGFLDLGSQFLRIGGLGDNVVRKAFGDQAAVGLVRDREDDFHEAAIGNSSAAVNAGFTPGSVLWTHCGPLLGRAILYAVRSESLRTVHGGAGEGRVTVERRSGRPRVMACRG